MRAVPEIEDLNNLPVWAWRDRRDVDRELAAQAGRAENWTGQPAAPKERSVAAQVLQALAETSQSSPVPVGPHRAAIGARLRAKWAREAAAAAIAYASIHGDYMLWTKIAPEQVNVIAFATGMGMWKTGMVVETFDAPYLVYKMEIA